MMLKGQLAMSKQDRKQNMQRLDNPYDSADQQSERGNFVDLGGKAEAKTSFGEPTGGLYSDPGDGTIGGVAKEFLERRQADQQAEHSSADARGGANAPNRDSSAAGGFAAGTSSDTAGQLPHGQGAQIGGSLAGGGGADDVGGMGTGTGRGRGSGTPGGVYGSGDSAGTGGMGGGFGSQAGTGAASGGLGSDSGGGVTGGTGGQGLPRRSDMTGTGGGVAVSGGRGSDVGTVGGGMADATNPNVSGGMSGGTMGGSRESDLGGGLSGGMRSGMGHDASGNRGGSVGDETGMAQPHGVPSTSDDQGAHTDIKQRPDQASGGKASRRGTTSQSD
jgi:hypothetical protein